MLRDHPRIVVVGTSGSGKTTFARQLSLILDRIHIELDALHWGPQWTVKPDFRERVKAAVKGEFWVVDGNYREVRDEIWPRATAIIWLNYPFHIVFRQALVRTVRRLVSREMLFGGNRESFYGAFLDKNGIPWWVIRTYRKRKREYPAQLTLPCYRHLELFELRNHAQAAELLSLEAELSDNSQVEGG